MNQPLGLALLAFQGLAGILDVVVEAVICTDQAPAEISMELLTDGNLVGIGVRRPKHQYPSSYDCYDYDYHDYHD